MSIEQLPTPEHEPHHLQGEVYGHSQVGHMDQLKESVLDRLFGTAEELLPSTATHAEIELPHRAASGFDVLMDDEDNIVKLPIYIDEHNRRRLGKTAKAAAAIAGLSVLALAAARIVPKIHVHKKD